MKCCSQRQIRTIYTECNKNNAPSVLVLVVDFLKYYIDFQRRYFSETPGALVLIQFVRTIYIKIYITQYGDLVHKIFAAVLYRCYRQDGIV